MRSFYKYAFWLILSVSIFLFNLWNTSKSRFNKDFELIKQVDRKRISSLLISNSISMRKINNLKGENILTHKKQTDLFADTSLVILLSTFKCDKCQEKELQRLDSLKKIIISKGSEINIFGITTEFYINEIKKQLKIIRINLPVYQIDDDAYVKLSFSNEFPQIVFVVKEIVISGFVPVPHDDEFSESYYNSILGKLN